VKRKLWRAALVAIGLTLICLRFHNGPPGLTVSDGAPTIEQLEPLSSLTVVKVDVADAIVTDLHGYTGGVKAVLVVHGSVTLGVDLSEAKFESVDTIKRRAVLRLPRPQVQSVSLDLRRTKLVGFWSFGLWTAVPGGEEADTATVNQAYAEAQARVAQAAQDERILDRARRQAEAVLEKFFASIGWRLEIRWVV
jgi:Protein of unknown function (DUF4230)